MREPPVRRWATGRKRVRGNYPVGGAVARSVGSDFSGRWAAGGVMEATGNPRADGVPSERSRKEGPVQLRRVDLIAALVLFGLTAGLALPAVNQAGKQNDLDTTKNN